MILLLETDEGGRKKVSVPNTHGPRGLVAFDTDCTILYEATDFHDLVEQIRKDGWTRIHQKDVKCSLGDSKECCWF